MFALGHKNIWTLIEEDLNIGQNISHPKEVIAVMIQSTLEWVCRVGCRVIVHQLRHRRRQSFNTLNKTDANPSSSSRAMSRDIKGHTEQSCDGPPNIGIKYLGYKIIIYCIISSTKGPAALQRLVVTENFIKNEEVLIQQRSELFGYQFFSVTFSCRLSRSDYGITTFVFPPNFGLCISWRKAGFNKSSFSCLCSQQREACRGSPVNTPPLNRWTRQKSLTLSTFIHRQKQRHTHIKAQRL